MNCDPRPGHSEWAFLGLRSARPVTWGVVEWRSLASVRASIAAGEYGEEDERFVASVLADIRDVAGRIRDLPIGAVVGVFGTMRNEYILFDRTPHATVR